MAAYAKNSLKYNFLIDFINGFNFLMTYNNSQNMGKI